MGATAISETHYAYKASPYSSHSLLVGAVPPEGGGRRVLDAGCAAGYLAGILAERGYKVTGIERAGGSGDHFPEAVELIEADLDKGLPPLRNSFSYVIWQETSSSICATRPRSSARWRRFSTRMAA